MRTIKTVSFLVLFFAANIAQAQGVLFVQQETRDGKTNTNQIQMDNGKPASVREVKEFRRETFPASTFEVPAGFTKQAMGMRQ